MGAMISSQRSIPIVARRIGDLSWAAALLDSGAEDRFFLLGALLLSDSFLVCRIYSQIQPNWWDQIAEEIGLRSDELTSR